MRQLTVSMIMLAVMVTVPDRARSQTTAASPPVAAPSPGAGDVQEGEVAAPTTPFDPTLKIYGFADAKFQQTLIRDTSQWYPATGDALSKYPTLLFGNLNLYLDAKPSPKSRSLV